MTKRIQIFDTTLRDGEQTPGVSLNVQEKIEIAKQLELLGVDIIEAGFPRVSNGDYEAVKAIAKAVKKPIVAGLARANKGDIDRAWEALKYAERPRIHTFIATSDIHMEYKLNMKPDEVLKKAIDMVTYAKSLCNDIEFSPEDGSRTRPEFLYKVLEAVINAGATVVNIPDTVGYTTPGEFGVFIRGIKENVPNINKAVISVHCHNDLGLAVANSLAAIENGAEQIECAINGLGERAGNAALEEIAMVLKTRKDYFDYETSVVTERIHRVSSMVSSFAGINIQKNKAIVGANAFAHESGIHQHGVINNSKTYEIMTPESIGLKQNNMVLGKHSGRHAFQERLNELGYNLDKDKIDEAFKKFKELSDKKKEISDSDIEALVNQNVIQVDEKYNLENFQVTTGNNMVSTATVRIKKDDKVMQEAACGDGPINALFNVIERTIGVNIKLEDYALKAITSGKDALGEVTVKVDIDGNKFIGRGISLDVIEASVKAYMNAINKFANK
ncbi:2-isopropylmalate synthase [Clostridium aestuarii]|uniref:2-isopropylmalate synthase n=1 Tax=Clostridium aestuarii TaxID=338193 RepID=A0ABT4D3W8_9CLOT|nr:2-isopropylmalate synthase [Clostridium aestuarii]MCY6485928.1 2-isopropylmalate synthase [Clostridium aestuarii]